MKKIIYILLAGFLWGFIGVSVKLIHGEINPFSLNFFRFLAAFLFLLIISPFIGKNELKISKKDIKSHAIIGLLFALTTTTFVYAVSRTTIANTVLLQSLQAFFVMIIAYFMLKEKITSAKLITLIFALVGIYIINPLGTGDLIGNIIAIISGFLFALLTAYMRFTDKKFRHSHTVWFMFFAALFMLPFPFIFGVGLLMKNLIYVLIIAVLGTALPYLFYNWFIEKSEADIAGLFSVIMLPLASIIFGILIIGEFITLTTLVGGVILISSIVYLEIHRKKI